MRRPAAFRFLILSLVGVFFGSAVIRAQTTSAPAGCPSSSNESQDEVQNHHPIVVVDDLVFDGPIHLPYSDLEPAVEELNQLKRSAADSVWLDDFLESRVRAAWQDHGYFKVLVSARAIPRGGDTTYQHFSVIVHVEEGKQYWIGDITFRTSNPDELLVFTPEELRELLPFHEGDLLNPDKIRKGFDAMKKRYTNEGYIDFTPTPETDVDDQRQRVSFRLILDQQRQFRIGKVTFCGSNPKFENLVNSLMKPGDVFAYPVFDAFFEKNRSELEPHFCPENVGYHRDVKTGTVDVAVTLRNCPLSQK